MEKRGSLPVQRQLPLLEDALDPLPRRTVFGDPLRPGMCRQPLGVKQQQPGMLDRLDAQQRRLVQVCQDAVKEWKFMPAAEESTQIVEFDFEGGN